MRFLDIDVERAGAGIVAAGDRGIFGRNAGQGNAADLVLVCLEIAVAKDADAVGILGELADHQVVVFALFDIIRCAAQVGAAFFERVLVAVFHRLHLRVGCATFEEDKVLERVVGARGRRRSIDRDGYGRERGIDVFPRLGGVGLAIDIRRERPVKILRRKR